MTNDTLLFDEFDGNISDPPQPLSLTLNHSAFPPLRLESRSLVTSATMFAVGVLGNLIAIVVLCISKREQKETTFYTLVCGMAITDLLGTCFTSPVVIATYVANRWPGGPLLCHFFSFSMLFFGSAGMSILCAMAVERYLAINHAYFYSKHIDRTTARLALLGTYLANIVLCIMPSFGLGQHVRHFPGTWCFLDWRATDPLGASYSFLYGSAMLLLILVTVLCNFAVCKSLVGMTQRPGIVRAEVCAQGSRRRFPRLRSVTSAAETQMFWLLIFMTIVFLVCSIPLVVRIFVNQLFGPAYVSAGGKPDYRSDILAIRFASFNPILDPWVYILCRKNLLVKGCEKLKRTVGRAKTGGGHDVGWTGGQHSPPSFDHSNETSYASLRTANCIRSDAATNKPSANLTMRQAWDYDTARVNFHPFSVEPGTVAGFEADAAAASKPTVATSTPVGGSGAPSRHHTRNVDVVTCSFSTPSSCWSERGL
ncbi:prostaglandin E receptor 4 (subtype EP4) c [Lampris incognitus]|uniref:prostaglandin E receptor 4 (subtype EP4) c n=1 Tax=Lampris incognitus TaxID=2546036 RepID=UPI0024B4BF7D|nr:prostaglandin E receptor 4 (subtype EP4) c [Lampris incognitus]